MDRKELKKDIVGLCSTVKIELACTIREIMIEHNVLKKELGWPVVINNSSYVDFVEVGREVAECRVVYEGGASAGMEGP